jgi:hypothetical protein
MSIHTTKFVDLHCESFSFTHSIFFLKKLDDIFREAYEAMIKKYWIGESARIFE